MNPYNDDSIYNDVNIPYEPLPRPTSAAMDAILGRTHGVLHDGFIRVVDYLGNDTSIVQAARVSYGAGTKTTSEDEQLIRFMMRHGHMTPFEQCEIKLHVRLPIDVMRQWVRHRTAHVNEYSTRYSEAIDSQHCVDVDEWRLQSSTNRQGSGATLGNWESVPTDAKQVAQLKCLEQRMIKCDSPGLYLSLQQSNLHQQARDTYEEQLAFGVAREQARAVLPLSTYTEIYWKCDLRNLLGFLQLRMAPDAQKEIGEYANVITDIVAQWVPQTWRAFRDYRLNAVTFSAVEVNLIRQALAVGSWLEMGTDGLSKREVSEFTAKLDRLGVNVKSLKGGAS